MCSFPLPAHTTPSPLSSAEGRRLHLGSKGVRADGNDVILPDG